VRDECFIAAVRWPKRGHDARLPRLPGAGVPRCGFRGVPAARSAGPLPTPVVQDSPARDRRLLGLKKYGTIADEMNLASRLSNIELQSVGTGEESSETQRLGALWAERPVVLAFIRHFG
jgi:hypothetical protein